MFSAWQSFSIIFFPLLLEVPAGMDSVGTRANSADNFIGFGGREIILRVRGVLLRFSVGR